MAMTKKPPECQKMLKRRRSAKRSGTTSTLTDLPETPQATDRAISKRGGRSSSSSGAPPSSSGAGSRALTWSLLTPTPKEALLAWIAMTSVVAGPRMNTKLSLAKKRAARVLVNSCMARLTSPSHGTRVHATLSLAIPVHRARANTSFCVEQRLLLCSLSSSSSRHFQCNAELPSHSFLAEPLEY